MTETIDWSQLITAEAVEEARLEDRRNAAKSLCRKHIVAVADETAQMNLTAAASAGLLTEEQMAVWQAALGWVSAMRAAWGPLAETDADLFDPASWPEVPAGVADLVAEF